MIRTIVRVSVCSLAVIVIAAGAAAQPAQKRQVCRGSCLGQVVTKAALHGNGMNRTDSMKTDKDGIIVWTLQRIAGQSVSLELSDFKPSCPGKFYVDGAEQPECHVTVSWNSNDEDWKTVRFEASNSASGKYSFSIDAREREGDTPRHIDDPEIEIDRSFFNIFQTVATILLAALAGFIGVRIGLASSRSRQAP